MNPDLGQKLETGGVTFVCLMGLRFSSVTAGSDGTVSHGLLHGATVGSSMLFAVLTKLSLGDAAQYGALVQLSPLAFAGWLDCL